MTKKHELDAKKRLKTGRTSSMDRLVYVIVTVLVQHIKQIRHNYIVQVHVDTSAEIALYISRFSAGSCVCIVYLSG